MDCDITRVKQLHISVHNRTIALSIIVTINFFFQLKIKYYKLIQKIQIKLGEILATLVIFITFTHSFWYNQYNRENKSQSAKELLASSGC